MDREVLLSILAMDSYNRGSGLGLASLTVTPGVTRAGNTLITKSIESLLSPRSVATSDGTFR